MSNGVTHAAADNFWSAFDTPARVTARGSPRAPHQSEPRRVPLLDVSARAHHEADRVPGARPAPPRWALRAPARGARRRLPARGDAAVRRNARRLTPQRPRGDVQRGLRRDPAGA